MQTMRASSQAVRPLAGAAARPAAFARPLGLRALKPARALAPAAPARKQVSRRPATDSCCQCSFRAPP